MGFKSTFFSFLILFSLLHSGTSQTVDHWETVVYNTDLWRYFVGSSEPPAAWKSATYNDSQWALGMGGIGYGDNDDNTQVTETVSLYLRMKFNLVDTSKISQAVLHADYDDAFVAYLNGVEIARQNIGSPGTSPTFDQTADGLHEAVLYAGGTPEAFMLPSSTLKNIVKEGDNVLAIQVHNQSITSSDLSSNFFFSVGISDESMTYGSPPDPNWFPQTFVSSNLPLIIINTTETSEIYDEPRVPAHMGIIDNGPGRRNFLSDDFNHYDGRISIEIRGASSQMFPKKNYGFETQDEDGENFNVNLLGMPKENDWVLHGPYADKTLLRNFLAYHMGRATGRYAPRTRFCELVINGDYRGVYILTERIKRDKNRVDIANLQPEDVAGDELTGGYILQIDRDDPTTEEDGWYSNFPDYKFYAYDDPDYDELLPVQKNYIKNHMDVFEQNMYASTYQETYADYVDVPSWIDYFLVTEVGKHIDAFKLSFFMYKVKDSKGGKIHFGPLWDFNLAYGNFDFACSPDPEGWSYLFGQDCSPWLPFWVKKLAEIPQVSNQTHCRWLELRNGPLHTDTLLQLIDENVAMLEEARERNFDRWPVLGAYVWPNNFIGQSYEEEILFLKNWLIQRLNWMDSNMLGNCDLFVANKHVRSEPSVKIYPNPAIEQLYVELDGMVGEEFRFQLYDLLGKEVDRQVINEQLNIMSLPAIPSGMYIYTISSGARQIEVGKLNILTGE